MPFFNAAGAAKCQRVRSLLGECRGENVGASPCEAETWIGWSEEAQHRGMCARHVLSEWRESNPGLQELCGMVPSLQELPAINKNIRNSSKEEQCSWAIPWYQLRIEFHAMHGIGHFFMYTFGHLDSVYESLLTPYMEAGLATRIHFQKRPEFHRLRHYWSINDCLYRAKSHAKWVLPTVDQDEYFRVTEPKLFPGGQVPENYLRDVWDAIVKYQGRGSWGFQVSPLIMLPFFHILCPDLHPIFH